MSNDQLQLEYSLQELPNLMALEIRQNMLWDKNKKLWPEAVEKFSQSIAKQNPLSSYIHKNMNTKRLGQHINKTPHHSVIPGKLEKDYQIDWHIEDGRIISPFGEYAYGVKILDTFSKKHSNLKPYEPYFEPTGRISDFAFLNTTGPVGLKFDTAMVENSCIVFDEETIDNDLSCINLIVDVGNHSHITLEEIVKPKLDSCKLIKITYLVRQGAKLEVLRRALGDDSSLTVIDSKFICFPESDVIVQSNGKGSHYTQEFFDFDIYRSSQVVLDGRYDLSKEQSNHVGVLVNHLENDSISDIDVKSVVDDKSNSSFIGNIYVDKTAVGTDAKLFNKNLLLSKNAVAVSEPQLDINTKEIACSHGCTVSNIDRDQLYLLQARGLDNQMARNTLKECFLK